jgi:hypothetical protein
MRTSRFNLTLPDKYIAWRKSVDDEVSFGYGGVGLFKINEIEDRQVGYARSADGDSLCSGEPGAWLPEWIAIGIETLCGDPIFINSAITSLPVFTAAHGEGSWAPALVASSLEGFDAALRRLRHLAIGREHPVALEKNPLPTNLRVKQFGWRMGPILNPPSGLNSSRNELQQFDPLFPYPINWYFGLLPNLAAVKALLEHY